MATVNPAYAQSDDYSLDGRESVSTLHRQNSDDRLDSVSVISNMNWDVFKTHTEQKRMSRSLRFWNRVHVVVRCVVCVTCFALVLATACFSKLLFLVTAYNINGTHTRRPSQSGTDAVVNVPWVWSMIIIITAPYIFTMVHSIMKILFKATPSLQLIPFLLVFLTETCHSVGLCLFVFLVAPSFNPILTLMLTHGVGAAPAIAKIFWRRKSNGIEILHRVFASGWWRLISVLTVGAQGAFIGVVTWKVSEHSYNVISSKTWCIVIPLSLVLVSLSWWDNFVQRRNTYYDRDAKERYMSQDKRSLLDRPEDFTHLLKMISRNRIRIDLFVSLWKIILTIFISGIVYGWGGEGCLSTFLMNDRHAIGCGVLRDLNTTLTVSAADNCADYLPYLVALVSVLSSGIGYKMAKSACKIQSQIWCYSLPLALSTPLCYILALVFFTMPLGQMVGCQLTWFTLPNSANMFQDYFSDQTNVVYLILALGGFLSILFVCAHIWVPTVGRVEATDRLFYRPLYCGVFFPTSLMMNRRTQDSVKISLTGKTPIQNGDIRPKSTPPLLYICVTMWHETELEIKQLLKSIFRMDLDQKTRVLAQQLNEADDIYNMEVHIMFDNAFGHENGEDPYLVNKYVKDFVQAASVALREVYPGLTDLEPPMKVVTPYGGRLVWTMPGENKLVVHLKHKEKIRIKKRWSQVMYMYYLLSQEKVCRRGMTDRALRKESENTFLLTLDGDVDFQPSAVQLLLDRMRKNKNVGAACGRIHPIGYGPMVWYQKFEYAMSHWLQKAAEHVIGCVLCSPGCFSMFRASALMDDNVIRRYTCESKEATEYIQFDQGEDRWLCTLLLQQGHRIEYCAAADAKTFAPTGFDEFFKQRRRWAPSTMANILDVLLTSGRIRRKNNDISLLYILYQGFLFISSVLTPGTIFLLVFSAINTAYPELPLYAAMMLNLFPVLIFIILLFTANQDVQIAYAGILSILYALVMMIVFVGVFKQIVESSFCSMSAGFFLFVAGIFFLSALLHPQEFVNVVHGFLYFLAIPCMSMLLMFYAFGNMHITAWGTRETYVVPGTEVGGKQGNKKKGKFQNILNKFKGSDDADSEYVLSFGNLLRCVCCPRPVLRDQVSKMELLLGKMEDVEHALIHMNDRDEDEYPEEVDEGKGVTVVGGQPTRWSQISHMLHGGGAKENPLFRLDIEAPIREDDDSGNPRWVNDPALGGDEQPVQLSQVEEEFWKQLIEKYLKPQKLSDNEKLEIADKLLRLRNSVCVFFFLSNSLFITLMFILESVSEYTPSLVFHLPCDEGEHKATREPVAIAFTLIFGVLLFIQFLCMLAHRFSTLLAIASITRVSFTNSAAVRKERILGLIEEMHVPRYEYDNYSVSSGTVISKMYDDTNIEQQHDNRDLMKRFLRDASRKRPVVKPNNLDSVVTQNFGEISKILEKHGPTSEQDQNAFSEQVLKKFPAMSNQSLFALAEIAMDDNKKKKIKELARQRWRKAIVEVQDTNSDNDPKPTEPHLLGVVKEVERRKANQLGETTPSGRLAQQGGSAEEESGQVQYTNRDNDPKPNKSKLFGVVDNLRKANKSGATTPTEVSPPNVRFADQEEEMGPVTDVESEESWVSDEEELTEL